MSLRRLWVLVSRLPQESHTARILHGEAAVWKVTDYLLARLTNITHLAHSSKKVPDSALIEPPGGWTQASKPKPKPQPKQRLGAADLDKLFTGGG